MRSTIKAVMLAALVGMLALATGAIAQTEAPPREKPADQQRGDRCPKAAHMPFRARGLVHSESKFQTDTGFATRTIDRGTITAVDHEAFALTIERPDGVDVTVSASEDTKVCRSGQKAAFSSLQVGDIATVMQGTKDSQTQVRAISARGADEPEPQARDRSEKRRPQRPGRGPSA